MSQLAEMERAGRIASRRLRAPRADAQTLLDPDPTQAISLAASNAAARSECNAEIGDRSVASHATATRSECLRLAYDYSRQYRDVDPPDPDRLLLLSGHQPELFHPGVWFKNFVLHTLASQGGGVACNLIVDADEATNLHVVTPTGSATRPQRVRIPIDAPLTTRPYEEREVADDACFSTFDRRIMAAISELVPDPLVRDWWPSVTARARAVRNLGLAISQARHALEGAWGLATLELPYHSVCESAGFRRFVAHLLLELPRFRTIHNRELATFRTVHRLRSRSHPVPELQRQDDWLESPFWVWTADAPQRQPLFARRQPHQVELRAGDLVLPVLPISAADQLQDIVEQLGQFARAGIKIRSRALTTTLFARLFLGDLFLHGIGGAKYDQLTDAIMGDFWQLNPPAYATVSATRLLPIGRNLEIPPPQAALAREARELRYHPERFLGELDLATNDQTAADQIVIAKRSWIAQAKTPNNARARHLGIEEANQALQAWLEPLWQSWQDRRAAARTQAQVVDVLGSREYAFCLFDESSLRELQNWAESICSATR